MIVDTNWLGNPWWQYLEFFGVVVLGVLVGKVFYWIISNIILKFASRTKTKLDDLIIHALKRPVLLAIFIASVFYGSSFIVMSDSFKSVFKSIISVLVTLDIAWIIMNVIDAIIVNYISPATAKTKTDLDDTLIPIIRKALKITIITVTIILIIDNFGYDVTSLIAGVGIGGLAFALAAQDLLANMFGGIAILTDKPFKLGDRIKVDGNDGFIKEIGLRTTRMMTLDGTMIVIPNSVIAHSTLENISKEKARKVKVTIGLTYDTPNKKLEQAKKIIADVIKENPDTLDESLVSFYNFGDSALEILVIYWIKNFDNLLGARDRVNFEIKKRFEKAKIEMAFPTQTVYVKKA